MNRSLLQDCDTTARAPRVTVSFGLRLQALRQQSGRSLPEMAYDLGIDNAFAESLESGMREPDLVLLETISLVFHLSLSELLDGI